MTIPYDDIDAYDDRWTGINPDELHRRAQKDPLLFAADHVSIRDRRAGAIVLAADMGPLAPPVLAVIPDGPIKPSAEACLGFLINAVDRLCEPFGGVNLEEGCESCAVKALGIVVHRAGVSRITDQDRRWDRALGMAAGWFGFEPMGVLSRTRDGAIIRVHTRDSVGSDLGDVAVGDLPAPGQSNGVQKSSIVSDQ